MFGSAQMSLAMTPPATLLPRPIPVRLLPLLHPLLKPISRRLRQSNRRCTHCQALGEASGAPLGAGARERARIVLFSRIPDGLLEYEWAIFKQLELGETLIPNKYKELMGIAVHSETKCRYCTLFHTEAAKMFVSSDGTGQKTVFAPNHLLPSGPVFSPDGTKIAFRYESGQDIWTINSDGSGLSDVTNTPTSERWEFSPDWGPKPASTG
jgi:AhpD family alkylhydroperoxidase